MIGGGRRGVQKRGNAGVEIGLNDGDQNTLRAQADFQIHVPGGLQQRRLGRQTDFDEFSRRALALMVRRSAELTDQGRVVGRHVGRFGAANAMANTAYQQSSCRNRKRPNPKPDA